MDLYICTILIIDISQLKLGTLYPSCTCTIQCTYIVYQGHILVKDSRLTCIQFIISFVMR